MKYTIMSVLLLASSALYCHCTSYQPTTIPRPEFGKELSLKFDPMHENSTAALHDNQKWFQPTQAITGQG